MPQGFPSDVCLDRHGSGNYPPSSMTFDLAGADAGTSIDTALASKMMADVGVTPVAAAVAERWSRRAMLDNLDLAHTGELNLGGREVDAIEDLHIGVERGLQLPTSDPGVGTEYRPGPAIGTST